MDKKEIILSFKQTYTLEYRKKASQKYLNGAEIRIPIIVQYHENFRKTYNLEILDTKTAIAAELRIIDILQHMKTKFNLKSNESAYIFANGRNLNPAQPINDVYKKYHDIDGFLYLQISTQETTG